MKQVHGRKSLSMGLAIGGMLSLFAAMGPAGAMRPPEKTIALTAVGVIEKPGFIYAAGGLAVSASGEDVYVAVSGVTADGKEGGSGIADISPANQAMEFIGWTASPEGKFSHLAYLARIRAIAVNSKGNIVIAGDFGSSQGIRRIKTFNASGKLLDDTVCRKAATGGDRYYAFRRLIAAKGPDVMGIAEEVVLMDGQRKIIWKDEMKDPRLHPVKKGQGIPAVLPGVHLYDVAYDSTRQVFYLAACQGMFTKFGANPNGDAQVVLLKMDYTGKLLKKVSFPGRRPAIVFHGDKIILVYDAKRDLTSQIRLRRMDLDLSYEKETELIHFPQPARVGIPTPWPPQLAVNPKGLIFVADTHNRQRFLQVVDWDFKKIADWTQWERGIGQAYLAPNEETCYMVEPQSSGSAATKPAKETQKLVLYRIDLK